MCGGKGMLGEILGIGGGILGSLFLGPEIGLLTGFGDAAGAGIGGFLGSSAGGLIGGESPLQAVEGGVGAGLTAGLAGPLSNVFGSTGAGLAAAGAIGGATGTGLQGGNPLLGGAIGGAAGGIAGLAGVTPAGLSDAGASGGGISPGVAGGIGGVAGGDVGPALAPSLSSGELQAATIGAAGDVGPSPASATTPFSSGALMPLDNPNADRLIPGGAASLGGTSPAGSPLGVSGDLTQPSIAGGSIGGEAPAAAIGEGGSMVDSTGFDWSTLGNQDFSSAGGDGSSLGSRILSGIGAHWPALLAGGALLPSLFMANQTVPGMSQLQAVTQQQAALAQSQQGEAATLLGYMNTGQVPGAAQAQLNQVSADAKAQIRSRFASAGMSGSTPEAQALGAVDSEVAAQKWQIIQSLTQAGLGALGQAGSTLSGEAGATQALMNAQIKQDEALQQAIARFASALAGGAIGGTTYQLTPTSG